MLGFFVAINKNNRAFPESMAAKMMDQLAAFGKDARQILIKDNIAVGVQQKWTLPEEQGEQQPLSKDNRYIFVFDGRVDNREVLLKFLKGNQITDHSSVSDAQLMFAFVLHSVLDSDLAQLNHVIGPYVFVLIDTRTNKVLAARDPMGGRHLLHHQDHEATLFSNYEMALTPHPSIEYRINRTKAARTLIGLMEAKSKSFIQDLKVLEPGHAKLIQGGSAITRRFYRPDARKRIRLKSAQDYATEFRRLLGQAVQRRLRTIGHVGNMMSGGLDSIPITILTQNALQSSSINHFAYSWIFDQYPDADERQFSEPVCQRFGIQQRQILCDDIWPHFDEHSYVNPINPFGIPYSAFHQVAFQQAQSDGVSVLLTGIHGDLLYGHANSIIYALLKQGRIREAVRHVRLYLRDTDSRWHIIKRLFLQPIPWLQRLHALRQGHKAFQHPFLSEELLGELRQEQGMERHPLEIESRRALRSAQWKNVLGGFAGDDVSMGRLMEAQYGIERRYPMRDRDLCEFMLAIPSDQLHYELFARPIVIDAFSQELPAEVKRRNAKTDFGKMINAKVEQDSKAKSWFEKEPRRWSDYVKECYFEPKPDNPEYSRLVWWRCAYYHYWYAMCYTENCKRVAAQH